MSEAKEGKEPAWIAYLRERPRSTFILDYSGERGYMPVCEVQDILAHIDALTTERDQSRGLCNGWMRAAQYATPVTTDAVDPMNPEAFAESRRHAVDMLATRSETAEARVRELEGALRDIVAIYRGQSNDSYDMACYARFFLTTPTRGAACIPQPRKT